MSIHPPEIPALVRLTAGEMLDRLAAGEVTSRALVEAHIARIEAIDGRVGAIVHRRFDAARREADAVDAARAEGPDPRPLAGLPITVKDNFHLEGTASTIGIRARLDHRASTDAVLVGRLRAAGAVILAKTNVPQLLLAQETENRIFGRTGNPWHLERSPGGSSGGESAAVASGMSPLGFGSDIGGSIRIPCHFTGIAGLKPTLDRWSNRGMVGAVPGQELVRAQCGPMARSVADLVRVWRALDPAEMAARDPYVPPMPAGDPAAVDLSGLRVGWYIDDGFLAPTPAIARAVERARDALIDAGATLVPFREPDEGEVLYLWLSAITSDGGATYQRVLDGEPFPDVLKQSANVLRLPEAARRGLAAVLERLGEKRVARLLRVLGRKPVEAYWDRVAARTAMRRAALDAWNDARVDAVLGPPHTTPAMAHGQSSDYTLGLANMFRYALCNLPAGIVPAARVGEGDRMPSPGRGADRVDKLQEAIDAGSLGLPVGVQIAARPYREDVALAVMAAIEQRLLVHEDFPHTPIDPMP